MGSSVLLIPFVLILRLHRRSPLHLSCLFPSLSILSLFSISVPQTTLLYTRISLSILSFRLLRFSLPGSLPLVSIPSRCPLEEGSEGISFSADKSLASLPNIDSRSNLRRDPSPSLPSVPLSLSHSFAWLVSFTLCTTTTLFSSFLLLTSAADVSYVVDKINRRYPRGISNNSGQREDDIGKTASGEKTCAKPVPEKYNAVIPRLWIPFDSGRSGVRYKRRIRRLPSRGISISELSPLYFSRSNDQRLLIL